MIHKGCIATLLRIVMWDGFGDGAFVECVGEAASRGEDGSYDSNDNMVLTSKML